MAKKLTAAERKRDEAMLALLEWAAENSKRWHDIGKLPEFKTAAELLERRGVIEIWRETNRYRRKSQRSK